VPFFDGLPFHFDKSPRLGEQSADARRADRHDVGIQHHERQPSVALQRVFQVETNDGLFLPILQPEIAGNPAFVLAYFALAFPPNLLPVMSSHSMNRPALI